MIFYTLVQMQMLRASDHFRKEFSLVLATYQGYSKQNLSPNKVEKSSFNLEGLGKWGKYLKEAGLDPESLVKDLVWTYGSQALGAPQRFLHWYKAQSKDYPVLQRIKNLKYLVRTQEEAQFLEFHFFYEVDFLFFTHKEDFHFMVPTWAGVGTFDRKKTQSEEKKEKSIWESHNFKRGRFFAQKEGANLPSNFPVIQVFKKPQVKMVKSIDLNKKTYQNTEVVLEKVNLWVKRLDAFEGERWGEVEIKKEEISQKVLVIYIPEDSPPEVVQQVKEKIKQLETTKLTIELKSFENSKAKED